MSLVVGLERACSICSGGLYSPASAGCRAVTAVESVETGRGQSLSESVSVGRISRPYQ